MTEPRKRRQDHSAVLDRIADQFSDHDALVTDDRRLTFARIARSRCGGPPRR